MAALATALAMASVLGAQPHPPASSRYLAQSGIAPFARASALGRCPPRPGARRVRATAGEGDAKADEVREVADDRVYAVEIDRRTGIDFGCDLSLRWPYVLALQPGGAADLHGRIEVGDQLVGIGDEPTVGALMPDVTDVLRASPGDTVRLTLFRGTRDDLKAAVGFVEGPSTVQITVKEEGKPERSFTVPSGANLRDELVKRDINVYRSLTRWTNCSGKQLCGTCIVDVVGGLASCSRKSVDEAATLRENPETYRLSCITQVHGDVVVEVQSPVGAAQWTR